jgi:dihydrofolate reductase
MNPLAASGFAENHCPVVRLAGQAVEGAIQQAKRAAGEKDVTVAGGPKVGQQLFKAGLVDEL